MFKKLSIALLGVLVAACVAGCANGSDNPPPSEAEEQEQTDYLFTDNGENGLCITKYTGSAASGTLEIPSEIAVRGGGGGPVNRAVTSIGKDAFGACGAGITKIIIPSSVKEIGENAFAGNAELQQVVFEGDSQLYSIGTGAFANNPALTQFTIPPRVQSLGEAVFEGSPVASFDVRTGDFSWTGDLLIKNNVSGSNGKIAVYANPLSETVTFPADVGITEANLFRGNKNIKTVDLANVTYLGALAFKDSALQTVTANKLEHADLADFGGTPWLAAQSGPIVRLNKILLSCTGGEEEITVPEGVERIGGGCFDSDNCKGVILPQSLTSVGVNAFGNCGALEWVLFKSYRPPFLDGDCFGESVVIYTKSINLNIYKSDIIFSFLPNTIRAKSVTVEFYDGNELLGSKTEQYYSPFDQYVNPPEKQGAKFVCWKDEDGNRVEINGMFDYTRDVKLTAYYE